MFPAIPSSRRSHLDLPLCASGPLKLPFDFCRSLFSFLEGIERSVSKSFKTHVIGSLMFAVAKTTRMPKLEVSQSAELIAIWCHVGEHLLSLAANTSIFQLSASSSSLQADLGCLHRSHNFHVPPRLSSLNAELHVHSLRERQDAASCDERCAEP